MRIQGGRVPLSTVFKMIRTPEIVRQTIKSGARKRVAAHLDYRFGNGRSAPFTQVDIKITNACNLRCKMCAQWGESGWHIGQPTSFFKDVVPLDIYKQMVDDVSGFGPWIYIWGGEPFLYPDLLPLTRYMKERGLVISVVTNGTTLMRDGRELAETGCDVLMASIDGQRDTHDTIRGIKGAFDKTLAGIKSLQEEKKRRRRVRPYIVILATVCKENAHNLDDVFEIGEEIHADGLVAYYAWFQTEESCQRHEAFMQEKLNTTPFSQRGWVWSYDEIDTDALVESVKRIKSRRWSFPYLFAPELKYEDIPCYYREHANLFGYGKCVAPWTTIEIMPNGDVATCRDYPDYVVGNIKENGILDIWNNERYRRFRAVLKEEKLLPICTRCCQLMGW
jgi:radical SAM protein with 4Fe4S-binding SPASM domain